MRYSLPDPWSRRMFVALCRRYGLKPFRYAHMKNQTVVVRGPRTFLEQTLWPQFTQIADALTAYLDEITDKVIREAVHGKAGEAEEVAETRLIAG